MNYKTYDWQVHRPRISVKQESKDQPQPDSLPEWTKSSIRRENLERKLDLTHSKPAGQLGRVQHNAFDPVQQHEPVPHLCELEGSWVCPDEHPPLQSGAVPLHPQTAEVTLPEIVWARMNTVNAQTAMLRNFLDISTRKPVNDMETRIQSVRSLRMDVYPWCVAFSWNYKRYTVRLRE